MIMISFGHLIFMYVFVNHFIGIHCAARVRRIVGGDLVPNDKFPIAISIKNSTDEAHLCGGILVGKDLVITAAHCVDTRRPSNYFVRLENAHLDNDNEINLNLTKSSISSIFLNEQYKKDMIGHDLAILKLTKTFPTLNNFYDDIFPKSGFGLSGNCEIYGFGATEMETERMFNDLRVGTVKIISLAQCASLLGAYIAPKPDSGMICAIGNSTDACQGDSGSPLICNGILEGVVSYGMGCGIDVLPGVYTRIHSHMKWIKQIISPEMKNERFESLTFISD